MVKATVETPTRSVSALLLNVRSAPAESVSSALRRSYSSPVSPRVMRSVPSSFEQTASKNRARCSRIGAGREAGGGQRIAVHADDRAVEEQPPPGAQRKHVRRGRLQRGRQPVGLLRDGDRVLPRPEVPVDRGADQRGPARGHGEVLRRRIGGGRRQVIDGEGCGDRGELEPGPAAAQQPDVPGEGGDAERERDDRQHDADGTGQNGDDAEQHPEPGRGERPFPGADEAEVVRLRPRAARQFSHRRTVLARRGAARDGFRRLPSIRSARLQAAVACFSWPGASPSVRGARRQASGRLLDAAASGFRVEVDPVAVVAAEAAVLLQEAVAAAVAVVRAELDGALVVQQAAAGAGEDLQPRPLLAGCRAPASAAGCPGARCAAGNRRPRRRRR